MCVAARTYRGSSCKLKAETDFGPTRGHQMVEEAKAALILVVDEIHETREGIERLLKADGYSVALSKDEPDAIQSVRRTRFDLILVSLAGSSSEVLASAR